MCFGVCFCLQRVHPSWCRLICRFFGSCRRFRHWHRGRRRCPWYSTTAASLRRNDPYPHLRRSIRSLRSHRRHLPLHKINYSCFLFFLPFLFASRRKTEMFHVFTTPPLSTPNHHLVRSFRFSPIISDIF